MLPNVWAMSAPRLAVTATDRVCAGAPIGHAKATPAAASWVMRFEERARPLIATGMSPEAASAGARRGRTPANRHDSDAVVFRTSRAVLASAALGWQEAARQIASLLGSAIKLSVITRSLYEIRKWLPGSHLANLRLFPESSDTLLIEQINGRTDETGQFLLPMASQQDNPDILFEQAQVAEEANDGATAERLYRRVMKLDPEDPAAPYNLGNLLRGNARVIEAEASYRSAIDADPQFAEAWYNLADILDEQGRADEAILCLQRAVDADPEYADAVFNLALFLQRLEKHAPAAQWWRRYLELDGSSLWAARARRALKFCEIQIAGSS